MQRSLQLRTIIITRCFPIEHSSERTRAVTGIPEHQEMPAMNGVELAIALTKMSPGVKILLVSGQAGTSDILEESRQKGFEFPLLAKPIHPLKLIDSLNALKEK